MEDLEDRGTEKDGVGHWERISGNGGFRGSGHRD